MRVVVIVVVIVLDDDDDDDDNDIGDVNNETTMMDRKISENTVLYYSY
jgi:hypothetical protein